MDCLWSTVRRYGFVAAVGVLSALIAITATEARADGGDPRLIHACVKPSTGTIRILGASELCKTGETPVHWTITGERATAYTDRAAFLNAAGPTTVIDFSTLPAGDSSYASLTLSGVTFKSFRSYYQQFIYQLPAQATIRIDLPAGTRTVGVDVGSFYGDPGLYTIALSSGQESTTTSATGFVGMVSDTPIEWVTLRFYSKCDPALIYGQPTCPGFLPTGYRAGVLVLDNFTFGPGPTGP